MRRYLLDSTPVAAYLSRRPAAVEFVTPRLRRRELATSILVYAEVTEYFRSFADAAHRQIELRRLLRPVYPLFLTCPILERYADIRRQLRPPYGCGLVGDIDTLIAATALEHDLTLVTADRDFERVPGLRIIRLPPGL